MGNLVTAPTTGGVSVTYRAPRMAGVWPATNLATAQDPYKPTLVTVFVTDFPFLDSRTTPVILFGTSA